MQSCYKIGDPLCVQMHLRNDARGIQMMKYGTRVVYLSDT